MRAEYTLISRAVRWIWDRRTTGRDMARTMVGNSSSSSNHMVEDSKAIRVEAAATQLLRGEGSSIISNSSNTMVAEDNSSSMDSTTKKSSWRRSLGRGYCASCRGCCVDDHGRHVRLCIIAFWQDTPGGRRNRIHTYRLYERGRTLGVQMS